MTRVTQHSVFALLVCLALPAGMHPQKGLQVQVLLEKELSDYTGQDIVLSVGEVAIPPGAAGSRHRHPGPTFVYVLEGAVEVELEGSPPKVYRAGESFYEHAHQLHINTRNVRARQPARILAYHLSHKGELLTQPEK